MTASAAAAKQTANIAVIGAGWWSQGWHLPQLFRNEKVNLAAIVDSSLHPKSNLANPNLESLSTLSTKYSSTPTFSSLSDLLNDSTLGPALDGVLVATPHATHYEIGEQLLREGARRRLDHGGEDYRPLHVLMEKPMTTNVHEAQKLHKLVSSQQGHDDGRACFLINHSANYRTKARVARELIESGEIGSIRHVTCFMASPLSFIFDDPANTGWNEGTGEMLGNGFAWGQCSHLLAWVFHVCPSLLPREVFCTMNTSPTTGADVSHSASIVCSSHTTPGDDVVLSMSGTSMLPGNVHSKPAIGKLLSIKIFGTEGAITYSGDDCIPSSGSLELRRDANNGHVELPCGPGFAFESLSQDGTGPESLESFIDACLGNDYYKGADSFVGLQTVQVLEAMYRSNASRKLEDVLHDATSD